MRQIQKFNIYPEVPHNTFSLGRYDKPIHIHAQHGLVAMWVEVDVSTINPPDQQRKFTIIPTGGHIGNNMIYVGTALVEQGKLVWHVYEVVE